MTIETFIGTNFVALKEMFRILKYLVPVVILVQSCYKDDFEVKFEPVNSIIEYEQLSLGEDYTTEVFYNLENKESHISQLRDWDLAFSNINGMPFLKLNTGNGWTAYKSNNDNMYDPINMGSISFLEWAIDNPEGDCGDMAFGDFYNVEDILHKVFLLRKDNFNGTYSYFKMSLLDINLESCIIDFMPVDAQQAQHLELRLPQDYTPSFYYLSIKGDKLNIADNDIEPKTNNWDINFTRYARYFEEDNLNYIVTGVLLNPKKTKVYVDSVSSFEDITIDDISAQNLSTNLEGIGYNWKSIDNSFEEYTVNKHYNYIIETMEGNFYKLRFLGFYNANHQKGNPSFEFKRL